MKKINLIVVFILIMITSSAQEIHQGFSIDNNKVIWQKVYDTELNFDQLITLVKESGRFYDIEISDSSIICRTDQIPADYTGAGYKRGLTPIYVLAYNLEVFVKIEWKQGRYRITVQNIILIKRADDQLGKKGDLRNLEVYAIKKGGNEYKSTFKKTSSVIYNYTFTNYFTYKLSIKKDNW